MRFTGQVKIPDLDYPGVPASVEVDGKQVELFVEGESLGRWSLVDVRAERLISSAFSLKLSGEEVTFIADQPTEFAYGGVEAMANVWARHRTMRLPRRIVANRRSRQGTKPSRIPDLREAIEETLVGTGLGSGHLARKPASGIASLREVPARGPTDTEDTAPAASPVEDRGVESEHGDAEPFDSRAGGEPPAAAALTDADALPDQRDPVPDSPDTPDAVLAEPEGEQVSQPPATDSVFKQSVPWARSEEAETDDLPDPEAAVASPVEPEIQEPELTESPGSDDRPPVPGDISEEPEPTVARSGSVPWLTPQAPDDRPGEAAGTSPETPPDDVDEVEPMGEPEHVVDLGALEDDDRGEDESGDGGNEATPVVSDEDENASRPMAATAARGGIMGAVRSAFVRNRVEHAHVYVEAPGGIGIKRQICADCGHISIGVE